jgi:hypothetical protein
MKNKLTKVEGEKLLYIHDDTGVYFIRIRGDGIDTERSLKTTKRSKARELRDEFVLEQADIKRGIKKEKPVKRLRVTASLDAYEKAGFPGIRSGTMSHPGPSAARTETDACNRLREFFRPNFVDELDHNLLDTYHDWRVENVKEGSNGGRTTDLELNTLSKALDWSVRKNKLKVNPIKTGRMRYYNKANARHCKELAPDSPEELHAAAAKLFENSESEVLGWQFLFEANFGMRTAETLALRRDAKSTNDPGFVKGDSMHVRRAKKNTLNPCIYLHDEGKILLAALNAWAEKRFPESKVYFPSTEKGVEVVYKGSLTAALRRLFKQGHIPRQFTSHGGRAYYVLVQRSNGIQDAVIAIQLNQVGGVKTLQDCYGAVPQHWLDGKGPHLKFLPADPTKYAWIPLFTLLGIKVGDVVPAPAV